MNIEEKVRLHINLLRGIDFNDVVDWFPIYLTEYEKEVMRESPYWSPNTDDINDGAFRHDLAVLVRDYFRYLDRDKVFDWREV